MQLGTSQYFPKAKWYIGRQEIFYLGPGLLKMCPLGLEGFFSEGLLGEGLIVPGAYLFPIEELMHYYQ